MKTQRNQNKLRKTIKGGNNSSLSKLIEAIINDAIKFKLNYSPNNNSDSEFYKLLVHSNCYKSILTRLRKKIIPLMSNPNRAFSMSYKLYNEENNVNLLLSSTVMFILFAAGLNYKPLTPDEIGSNLARDNNYLITNYIINIHASKLLALINYNSNLGKIKTIVNMHPNLLDAEALDMLTEYFEDEKTSPAQINIGVSPSNISL